MRSFLYRLQRPVVPLRRFPGLDLSGQIAQRLFLDIGNVHDIAQRGVLSRVIGKPFLDAVRVHIPGDPFPFLLHRIRVLLKVPVLFLVPGDLLPRRPLVVDGGNDPVADPRAPGVHCAGLPLNLQVALDQDQLRPGLGVFRRLRPLRRCLLLCRDDPRRRPVRPLRDAQGLCAYLRSAGVLARSFASSASVICPILPPGLGEALARQGRIPCAIAALARMSF